MAAKKADEAVIEAPEAAPVMGYKVVGVKAVYDTAPGDFIERPLSAEEVKFLIGAGSIALTEKKEA